MAAEMSGAVRGFEDGYYAAIRSYQNEINLRVEQSKYKEEAATDETTRLIEFGARIALLGLGATMAQRAMGRFDR